VQDYYFKQICENMDLGLRVISKDCRMLIANPAFLSLVGLSKEECLGQECRRVFKHGFCGSENCLFKRIEAGAKDIRAESDYLMTNGKRLFYEFSAFGLFDNEGELSAVAEIIRDVSKSRAIHADLRKAKEYAESIIATLHEAFLVLDRNLRVKSANKSFYALFETTPQETEGRLVYELGEKEWEIPKLKAMLRGVLESGKSFQGFEVEHDFKRIGSKTMLINCKRIEELYPEENLIFMAVEDITRQRQAEHELKDLNRQLRASEQQLRAANQQLRASEQQLRAANQQLRAEIGERNKIEAELGKRLHEAEVLYKASIGREERILELKKEVEKLKKELQNQQEKQ